MDKIPRRKIKELFFLYEFEPELYDIYVEGPFDAAVIKYYLKSIGLPNNNVYEISTIEIDDQALISKGRDANNRERVILLSEEFENYNLNTNQLTCIVDKDFCHNLKNCYENLSLFMTDFTCMEMYFFDPLLLSNYLTCCCYKSEWPCAIILANLCSYLRSLYFFRMANHSLNWKMGMINQVKCVEIKGWNIEFEEEAYLDRLLNKNCRMGQKDIFLQTTEQYKKNIDGDPRDLINGHDFVNILCYLLSKKGIKRNFANEKFILRALLLSSTKEYFMQFELFKNLVRRLS